MKEKILKFFIATLAAVAVLAGGVSYSKGVNCTLWGLTGVLQREWVPNNGIDPVTGEKLLMGQFPQRYNPALRAVNGAITACGLKTGGAAPKKYGINVTITKTPWGENQYFTDVSLTQWFGLSKEVVENAFLQAGGNYSQHPVPKDVQDRTQAILAPIAIQNVQMHLNGGKAVTSAQPAVAQTTGLTKTQKDQIKAQIKTQQEYITSLQSQYQNAMNTGNVAYAQQCQQLIALWQASNDQLQAQLK